MGFYIGAEARGVGGRGARLVLDGEEVEIQSFAKGLTRISADFDPSKKKLNN